MRTLHYYPNNDSMVATYVTTICDSMGSECFNDKTSDAADALKRISDYHYDILHLHGCWRNSLYRVVREAQKKNIRIIVTPHGQLEPWVMNENYWKEKLPKKLLYQKRIVSSAYVVIIQGKMEEECVKRLHWNKRMAIVPNSLITNAITSRQMVGQIYNVYREVLDSNPLERMSDNTQHTLLQLIKVGITGDSRWLKESIITINDEEQWRMLLCYARQEQIEDIIKKGMRVVNLETPNIDLSKTSYFVPNDYQPSKSIESVIGMQFASENERLIATFRHIRKLLLRRKLTVMHLIELDKELRQHDCDEEALCEELSSRGLYQTAARTMQLMAEMSGLDEGFMPMRPINDRITRKIKKQITNHLKL